MPMISDPLEIRSVRLRNRIVMAPIATGLAVDNCITDAHIRWYAAPAQAGVSLVIVEASGVAPDACILPNQIGVWDDKFIPGLKQLADSIHSKGAKTLIQLVHGGGRSWRGDGDSTARMAPSGVLLLPGPAPIEMNEAEIKSVINSYVASAKRARAAGFDGVEIHGAHYYLFSQFLSPLTNRRTDKWGKDVEGRSRFLTETVKAIRSETGPDYIISCRVHAVEFFEGGMPHEDSVSIVKLLEGAGVDLIDASGVGSGSWETEGGQKYLKTISVPPADGEPGIYLPYMAKLKEACNLPVAAVGRLAEPGAADDALKQGLDLVAIARQIIADPQTPEKLLEDRPSDINRCTKCLNCFKTNRSGGIRCHVNSAWLG